METSLKTQEIWRCRSETAVIAVFFDTSTLISEEIAQNVVAERTHNSYHFGRTLFIDTERCISNFVFSSCYRPKSLSISI